MKEFVKKDFIKNLKPGVIGSISIDSSLMEKPMIKGVHYFDKRPTGVYYTVPHVKYCKSLQCFILSDGHFVSQKYVCNFIPDE